jgi:anti-sigma B factor antagonist
MEIKYSTLGGEVRLIKLTGRLDVIGTEQIEAKFAGYCSGDKLQVIVDMSGVDFLDSIGIRLLVLTAEAMAQRRGRMVLLSPTTNVHDILDLSGVMAIVPVYDNMESALAVVSAP